MEEEIEVKKEVLDPPKSKKELWSANLKSKYPDRDFSDEDELYAASMEGYDNEHEYRKKIDRENGELVEKLTANPDVAMFIGSLVSGESLYRAMSHLRDILPLNENDEGWNEYNAGVEERNAKANEAEAAAKAYEENIKESAEAIKAFADKNGMTEDETMEFLRGITDKLTNKLFAGKIDDEFLQLFFDASHYESDVADAEEAGRIAGRNEQIKAKRARRKTDGLPALNASANPPSMKEESGTVASLKSMLGNRDPYFMKQ